MRRLQGDFHIPTWKGQCAEAVNKESGELKCSQRAVLGAESWELGGLVHTMVMGGYRVFKKDQQGRRGARIALCVRSSFPAQSSCMNVEMYY